jgi:hypothetical protein
MLCPLPFKTAAEVLHALVSCFAMLGFPKIIQLDNGREFNNEVMSQLTTNFGMEHYLLMPYVTKLLIGIIKIPIEIKLLKESMAIDS